MIRLDNAYLKSHHYLPLKDRLNDLPALCLYLTEYNKEKKIYTETEINIQFNDITQQEIWKTTIVNTIKENNNKVNSIFNKGVSYLSSQFQASIDDHKLCNDNGIKLLHKLNADSKFQNMVKQTNNHSNIMINRSIGLNHEIPLPKLTIVILVVGTRGDVQPFVSIGKRLREDGHRVRIATHETYRKYITIDNGFEFYPLAGDPLKLSEFMVRNEGALIPTSRKQLDEFPECLQTTIDIMKSCLGACTSPDPLDPTEKSFTANAIISNPVSNGHFHCADAMGIPLHMMFPQPWTPTKAFPHPLTNLSYETTWDSKNYLSYNSLDKLMWVSMKLHVNDFRYNTLGLARFRTGEGGAFVLNSRKVPFVKMWSPHLLPKPKDWSEHVDVVGNFNDEVETMKPSVANESIIIDDSQKQTVIPDPSFAAPPELLEFLEEGAPVFIGFGSMVLGSMEDFLRKMLSGACLAGVKVLIQMGWSACTPELFRSIGMEVEAKYGSGNIGGLSKWEATKHSFMVGPCPHTWLFQYVSACVHHGGAGTTAAGISAGKPTLVCYLFGDQPLWGQAICNNEIGPAPHRLSTITPSILSARLKDLVSSKYRINALKMREKVLSDDGIGNAVNAFYRNLPIDEMICDVSIYMGESKLANYYCQDCCLKLSGDICDVIHSDPHLKNHTIVPAIYVNWNKGPVTFKEGVYEGFVGLNHDLMAGVGSFFMEPAKGVQTDSISGTLKGTAVGVFKLCASPFTGLHHMGKKIRQGMKGGDGSDKIPANMKSLRMRQQIERVISRGSVSSSPRFPNSVSSKPASTMSENKGNDNASTFDDNDDNMLDIDSDAEADNNDDNNNDKKTQPARIFGSRYVRRLSVDNVRSSEMQVYLNEISDAYNKATRVSYLLKQLTGESRYMSIETFNNLVLDANNKHNITNTTNYNNDNINNEEMLNALMNVLGYQGSKYLSRIELSLMANNNNNNNNEPIIWKNKPKKQVKVMKKIIADIQ